MLDINHITQSVSLLRVIRILRFNSLLVSYSPDLKLGWDGLRRSKTAAYYLCLFLFLVIFVYSLIGAVAFRNVTDISPINDRISFFTVGQAIIVMIQMSTSAGWDGLYRALIAEQQFNPFVVFLFLWSFLFICILIIINLVLTIILNYYTKAYETETEINKLRASDLNDFDEKWRALAPQDEPLFINKAQLPILLNHLDNSSALRSSVIPNEENIQLLGIPVHGEQQLYHGDVLIALNKARLWQTTSKK